MLVTLCIELCPWGLAAQNVVMATRVNTSGALGQLQHLKIIPDLAYWIFHVIRFLHDLRLHRCVRLWSENMIQSGKHLPCKCEELSLGRI